MPTMEVTDINVAYPESGELHLRLSVGACQLRVKPGDGDAWVTGTYRHPAGTLSAIIEQNGGTLRITQDTSHWANLWGNWDHESIPRFDLTLGKSRPFAITLELGASENLVDLGGLPVTQLHIKQGAGKVELAFSAPNPQTMQLFEMSTGASGIEVHDMANANASRIRAEGGAAGFVFDFGGELRQNTEMNVSTAVAGVDLNIPASTPARVTVDAVMGGVDLGDGWMKKEGAYMNEAAIAGKTPTLSVTAKITMGGIKLRTH